MADAADDLGLVPLFSSLSQRQRKRLARDMRVRTFKAGTRVVREGHMSGVGFFIVADGEASLTLEGREVGRLRAGDHFGELGLLSEKPRTATVTADEEFRCLEIPAWHFRRFVKDNPEVAWKLLRHLADLVAAAEERSRAERLPA